jgi:NTE family protein
LQLGPAAYAAWKAALPNPRAPAGPTVGFVETGDTAPLVASMIDARMPEVKVGQPLDVTGLEVALNRVYGLGIYANVRYQMIERDGQQGLALELVPPSSVRGAQGYGLGLNYSSATGEDPRFGLAASVQREAINDHGGEWRASFLFGDEPGFTGYFNQPFGPKGLNFFSPSLDIGAQLLNLFEDDELVAEYNLRSAIFEFGAGRELMDWAEVRGGFRVGAGDTRLRVGDAGSIPYDSFHRGEVFTRFSVDTLDNVAFPHEGSFARIEWRGSNASVLGADHDYDQLLLSAAHAKTWGRHTLLSTLRIDTTISGVSPAYALFEIGGFRDLSGLNSDELSGQHVTRLGASVYREIGDLALFQVYVGANIEVGNAWASRDDIDLGRSIWGGSLWAGVDTPLGPVFLAWGSREGGEDAFYVYLGRLF